MAQVSRVAKNRRARRKMRVAATPLALREAFLGNLPETATKSTRKGQYKLLTLILCEQRFLDDITQLFCERGVRGASVQESTGLFRVRSKVPFLAGFLNFLRGRQAQSRIITTVVHENEVAGLIERVEDIVGDLNTHSGVMVYTTDLSFQKGSLEAS